MKTQQDIENLLLKLPHHYQVSFAVHCAQSCLDKVPAKDRPTIEQTLNTVSRWLNGEAVSQAELEDAAWSAESAAWSAARAAWTANDKRINEYYLYLVNHVVAKITDLEKFLYNIEVAI